jgi:protein-lysine N-methyltransferase EEF2KMT
MVQRREHLTYSFPTIGLTATVTLLESRSVISSAGATGLRTWESAIHLSSFLAFETGSVFIKDKQVLELGAGTGLVSILCAKYMQPKFIRCTDGNEGAVDVIRENLFVNDLNDNEVVESRPLLWGRSIPDYGDETLRAFDTVLGADIVSRYFIRIIDTDQIDLR